MVTGLQAKKIPRLFRIIAMRLLLCFSSLILGACDTVGPYSIKLGRNFYNDAIHQTSADQLLLNLVRIHDHEMPLFMDVTEVDATVQVQATVSGGTSNIGAQKGMTGGTLAGQISNVSGSGQYLEAPTVRYQPLQGNPLIAQLNSPITIDSLVYMFDSDWTLDTVLPLTVDRLAPGYADYYAALHSIIELDHNGALVIEANQVSETEVRGKNQGSRSEKDAGGAKALTLFFSAKGLANNHFRCDTGLEYTRLNIERVAIHHWLRLLRIYRGMNVSALHATVHSASLPELQAIITRLPHSIHIPAASLRVNDGRLPPLLRTRSALGVLKNLAEGEHSLAMFVSPEKASDIINAQSDDPECRREHFYVIDDSILSGVADSSGRASRIDYKRDPDPRLEGIIFNKRKYILIQESVTPPISAFATVHENGKYYFIASNDDISKRTFALLQLITSVQAIPAPSAGLTPALSIGPR